MRKMAVAAALFLIPLCGCDQPQGTGSSSQQGATGSAARSSGTAATASPGPQQQSEIPRIGPNGEHLAGSQPQPATGTVPNDASGPMAAPNSLNSGASDPQLQKAEPPAQRQERSVGTSRPTAMGTDR